MTIQRLRVPHTSFICVPKLFSALRMAAGYPCSAANTFNFPIAPSEIIGV